MIRMYPTDTNHACGGGSLSAYPPLFCAVCSKPVNPQVYRFVLHDAHKHVRGRRPCVHYFPTIPAQHGFGEQVDTGGCPAASHCYVMDLVSIYLFIYFFFFFLPFSVLKLLPV